jgi:hypothetical protein
MGLIRSAQMSLDRFGPAFFRVVSIAYLGWERIASEERNPTVVLTSIAYAHANRLET